MSAKNAINKTWYKVPCGYGYSMWLSIEELFENSKRLGYFRPIEKIVEVTENQLDDSVVDELNNKLKEYYAEKANA